MGEQEHKALFAKYDADKDGKLSKKEVLHYAKAELEYTLEAAEFKKIEGQLFRDSKGVTYGDFRLLRKMVAIARSEARDRQRRAEEAEKERIRLEELARKKAEIERKKVEAQKALDEVSEIVNKTEEECEKVLSKANPLGFRGSTELDGTSLQELALEIQIAVPAATESLEAVQKKVADVEAVYAEDEAEVKIVVTRQAGSMKGKLASLQAQLEKASNNSKSAIDRAAKKVYSELEYLRSHIFKQLREYMVAEKKPAEDVYKGIAGDGEVVTKEQFLKFLETLPSVKLDGRGENVFQHLVESVGDTETLSKGQFMELARLFYKVIRATVLTEDMSIKSQIVKRLEPGAVVEGLQLPEKDETVDVTRIRCKLMPDGPEGFVTVCGTQGSAFLEAGGRVMTVVKDTIMTDGFVVADSATVRMVSKGEFFDVLEFEKAEAEESDVRRIKGKARSDGVVGYITVSNGEDNIIMEHV